MMKKALFFVAGLLILAGCKKETIIDNPTPQSAKTRSIVFSIGKPAGKPTTYVTHDLEEFKISSIQVFEFEYPDANTTPDENGVLRKVYTQGTGPNDLKLSGAQSNPNNSAMTLTLEVPADDTGFRRFLFVANAIPGTTIVDDLTGIHQGTKLSEVMKKLTPALIDKTANLRPDFLMTGFSSRDNIVPGFTSNETIMLTRVVARVDLAIGLDNPNDALVITSAKLINAPKYTNLYPSGNLVSGRTHLDPSGGSISYAPVTTTSALQLTSDPDYNKGRIPKLFYLYERTKDQFATNGTPTLRLEGNYTPEGKSPVKVRYELVFDKNIVRNYLYTFVLGIAPDSKLGYTGKLLALKVKKWEDDLVTDHSLSILKVSASTGASYSFNADDHTFSVSTAAALDVTDVLTVSSGFANDPNPTVEVLKTNPLIGHPNNDWITATATPGKVSLKIEKNTTGAERKGVIWFKSPKDVGGKGLYALTVKQAG